VAYRGGTYTELCIECRSPARERCPRCGDPLCPSHLPSAERRCVICESRYLRRETDGIRMVAVSLMPLAAIAALIGAVGVHMVRNGYLTGRAAEIAPLILIAALVALPTIFALPPLVRRRLRRRFLAERPGSAVSGAERPRCSAS
jgi:uncharacterized protein (DUF983 family)